MHLCMFQLCFFLSVVLYMNPNPILVSWPYRSFPTDYPRCLLFTSRGLRRGVCWEKTGWGLLKARSQHTKVSEREKIQTQKLRVLTCQKGRGCSLQLSGYLIWKALPPKFEHSSERSVLVCPDSCPEQPPANATDRHKEQRLKTQTQSPCPFFFCCLLKKWKRKKVW